MYPKNIATLMVMLNETLSRQAAGLSQNLFSIASLIHDQDNTALFEKMRDLLSDIEVNTRSSGSGSGGVLVEQLRNLLFDIFGSETSQMIGRQDSPTEVAGFSFDKTTFDLYGTYNIRDALSLLAESQAYFSSSATSNQGKMALLFWKAFTGSEGSGSSSSPAWVFKSDVFAPVDPYFKEGKKFRAFSKTDEFKPQSLLEALMVLNNNLTRGTFVASENAVAHGDLVYWATTNLVSKLNPSEYWGEKIDEGPDSDYIYRFGSSGATSGDIPFDPTNYVPSFDMGYTNFVGNIMAHTNKVDVLSTDAILERYYVASAFETDGSYSKIEFEGRDSDWGTIKINVPGFGKSRLGDMEMTLPLKEGWYDGIKDKAVSLLDTILRPVAVAFWYFVGGISCFVILKKVGGL